MTAVSEPEAYEFATDDPDLAYAMICARYSDSTFRISGHRDAFQLHLRGTDTDRFSLERMRQSVAFGTSTAPSGALFVARPRAGRCDVSTDEREVQFGPGETVLIDPLRPLSTCLDDVDYDVVRLDLGETARIAADLSGLAPEGVRFWLSRPLSASRERHWHAAAEHVRRDVLGDPEIAASPMARAEAFRLLATTLIHTFPNTALDAVEDATRRDAGSAEPAVVRRAIDFMERHAGEPIDLADIAEAAGIGPRGLQHAFRKHRDTTPRAHLLAVRLERAHHELLEGDPARGDTVSGVARRWGFTHLGRFTAAYRRRFGPPPSETLRR
ncbi:AraC family transcriptional regulator [Actinomycetospora endophytica]|uniref:AraC family transcriptional regulator n=1 Tax=Actinomycetospora endophytica TaxID=2291215 RepID=A0ABS8PH44_9PSEU|nr:AraC family transcriptional regulator [Actinomycetospora endophytica]MCD2197562.1 AraC family transcriptional regulator [Actinomycetospora endophytica]